MVHVLEKKDAVVHIASIDVKIIRLEKKQVTLSVFRQLEEKSIFVAGNNTLDNRKSPKLLGKLWGRVNYVWKGCPEWATYHLVWQESDKLRRMPCIHRNEFCDCYEDWIDDERPKSRSQQMFVWMNLQQVWYQGHKMTVSGYVETENKSKLFDKYTRMFSEFDILDQLFIAV